MSELIDVSNYNQNSILKDYIDKNPEVKVAKLQMCPNYLITTDGNIYSRTSDKFLKKQCCKGNGYYEKVMINIDHGIKRNMRVHRLVALAFLNNPDNLTDVDHINNNRSDNRIQNLRWLSHKDNMNNLKCHNL